MQYSLEKIKKFVFHIVFTSVIGAFLSIYIGFLMPSQMPNLHKKLYQTLCKANETVTVNTTQFSLPGEIRVSTNVSCVNTNAKIRPISELKAFVVVGFLYPFVFSFLLSLIFYRLFFKRKLT
jgi:hypothetical protein